MILWLDHLIFGDGFGLRSPYYDNRFYWLSGELYTFWPGLGAQLTSIQWTHPNAGEERTLSNRKFRPLNSHRRWGRVMIAWGMVGLPKDLDQAHAEIASLKASLGETSP